MEIIDLVLNVIVLMFYEAPTRHGTDIDTLIHVIIYNLKK